ncbi:MAG: cytochrome c peroxidase [Cyclobacteriaceae bacterium]
MRLLSIFTFLVVLNIACEQSPELIVDQAENSEADSTDQGSGSNDIIFATSAKQLFEGVIDFDNLPNYANQEVPNYINSDNTNGNEIIDEVAVLGRVLFYDKQLSSDNTIACASCHQQDFAFSDNEIASQGVNGNTGRHSMRLINARFSQERRFFWDERATTLEEQTTMPIQDHFEMGYSGTDGDEDIHGLIAKLETNQYMLDLFEMAFDNEEITEEKMQTALAQFIRSIQSFDSKYDEGRAQVNNDDNNFLNFTAEENLGKALFVGRAGCNRCHRAPEFAIDNNSRNNGVITTIANDGSIDVDVTRAPTLRDIFNAEGRLNGSLMHDGSFGTIEEVIAHYNIIPTSSSNTNLDNRLSGGPNGNGENLNLNNSQVAAISAFIATLSGTAVYTDDKWSDPFVDIN